MLPGPAMAQAVCHRPLTAEIRLQLQISQCGKSVTGAGFTPSASVFPVIIIPPSPHTHSQTHRRRHTISTGDSVVKQRT